MNILVVGYEGFIGSHIFRYFKKFDHFQVFGCGTRNPTNLKEKIWKVDRENSDYFQIFESFNFDVCVNASGASSVPYSLEKPYDDFRLNTFNVLKLLEAIRICSPNCKFINLSSAAVYGNPIELPVQEKAKTNPLSPYGYHKLQSEQIATEYAEFFNVKTLSLRIFSAYGPGLKKQIFWDLTQKYLKMKEEIELFGTGLESRDFIYIDDIVNVIALAINKADFCGEAVNVGNGEEIYMKDAVKLFYEVLDMNRVLFRFSGNSRKGDPANWKADINLLKRWGYCRKVSFEKGLINYIQWLKKEGLV